MALFEKIELESMEPEDTDDILPSPVRWKDETLTVAYPPWKKVVLLFFCLLLWPLLSSFLEDGSFAMEALLVVAVVFGVWFLADCLNTRDFTFSPDGIAKRGYFGKTVLPVNAVVMDADEQKIRLCHGTEKNIRESVKIHRYLITTDESVDIQKYATDVYKVSRRGKDKAAQGKKGKLALTEFEKSVSSYRLLSATFVTYAVVAVFTVGLSDMFAGLAPSLPAYPARIVCIALAIAAFFILRLLAPSAIRGGIGGDPPALLLQKADEHGFVSGLVASGVALMGLVLFLLLGNIFDFYIFLLVGVLYYFEHYPRLSDWERLSSSGVAAETKEEVRVAVPRRSLQVSLVLMGALAVLSYGESRHYVYNSRQDCLDDWGSDKDCTEAPSSGGSGSYGARRYYGPRYGSGGGAPTKSVGVTSISRGGFGSLGSFHASFGG